MEKLYYILILITFFTSCEKPGRTKFTKTDISFIGFRELGKELQEINLDYILNFNELLFEIDRTICEDKIAVIKFETDSSVYKIQPFMSLCSKAPMDIWCYSLNDIIYVSHDSINVNEKLKYPIDSLKIILNRHLMNPENDPNYPKRRNNVFMRSSGMISINVDSSKSINYTKELLLNIIKDFREIENDSITLKILFEDSGFEPYLMVD